MTTTQDLEAPIKVEEATGSLQSGTAVTSQSRTKSEVDSLEPEADFPEGGWQAYLVIAGSWCCSFMTFGLVNTFGIYQSYYSRELLSDKTSSQIAWIGSFQYFGIFATGVFAGRAFDVGLFRPLMLAGMIILVVCQMLLSLCTEYWQLFLCQGVGLGLGFGIVFNLSVAVPSHWFKKRRATAMGILASGSSAGGICLPIMLTRLIEDDSLGFAWTNRVVGFLALIMFIFAFFTMQTRLQPAYSLKNGQWRHVELTKVGMFRIPAYSFFVLGAILILFGLYTPFQFMDTATSSEGIPADGYWLAILNAGSCVGRIVPGFLADRLGRMNTLVPHLGISSLILFIFPLCITSFGGLLPFSLIYGYGTGCYVSLIPSAIGQLVPTKDFGTALGQCFFIASFGALVGLPISGEILGTQAPYNWWAALGYSGACASAGTLAMVASRYYALQGKWRGRI